MTATIYPRTNIYSNLGAFAIATGVVVITFSLFGFLRATVFSQAAVEMETEVKPPSSLYERQPTTDNELIATPTPVMMPEGTDEYPVILAETGSDATSDLDALWQQRQSGQLPAEGNVPGCAPCPEETGFTGFSSGSGTHVSETDINQKSGYYTTSGMRGGHSK